MLNRSSAIRRQRRKGTRPEANNSMPHGRLMLSSEIVISMFRGDLQEEGQVKVHQKVRLLSEVQCT